MKIAIFSDVHSNLEAMQAVVERARACGADKYVCLGDMLGYGPDPAATLDLIMGLPALTAVIGNHDETVMGTGRYTANRWIEAVADWSRQQLRPAHFDFLRSLPYFAFGDGVTYVHASVDSPLEWIYIREPGQARNCLKAANTPVVFVGHVHVPALYRLKGSDIVKLPQEAGDTVVLDAQSRYVVVVGSVGQPRDGDPRACFAIYDTDARQLTVERVTYDHARTAVKIRAAGFLEYFADRLTLGH